MPSPAFRIGNGFDIHRLEEGYPLILGGVKIPHSKGSVGHSDGDVLTHAIIDALLGAAALGDIGTHFPPSDDSIKGIDSMHMLDKIIGMLTEAGYTVGNIDTTIVLEKPKLSPHYPEMRTKLAAVLRVNENQIGLKAKTYEKMGDIGAGNAISAYAVALITS
jgi:2-C-methyl-D-erythritol 2,4-cyclodiphosphate synthase